MSLFSPKQYIYMRVALIVAIGLSCTILLACACFWWTTYSEACVANRCYLIQSTNDKDRQKKVAETLDTLYTKAKRVLSHLQASDPQDMRTTRLQTVLEDHKHLREVEKHYVGAAYTVGKKTISVCVPEESFNMNTAFLVYTHEISHAINKSYGHDAAFWETFAWLLRAASRSGEYVRTDYVSSPTSFCGQTISSNVD